MNLDRISACNVSSLVGPEQSQAASIRSQSQSNAELKRLQSLSMGNRCEHNKNKIKISPVYGNSTSRNRRPHVIEQSGNRLRYLAKHLRAGISKEDIRQERDKPTGMLPWYVSLFENERFLGLLYHVRDSQPARKRRSEGLEAALFITLATLVFGCDLHKLAYGHYDNRNGFHYFDYAKLAKDSGLNEIRLKRAMKLLKDIGLVKVTPMYKTLNDGHVITDYTMIDLSGEIFSLLGLDAEFLKDREDAFIRWQKRENKIDAKDKRQSLYKPRPLSSRKVDNRRPKGCQSIASGLTNNLRPNYSAAYNPACDKQVIALAGELINARLCANMRDAITLAATKLGKSPPS